MTGYIVRVIFTCHSCILISCAGFEGITVLLFVASVAEYDQTLVRHSVLTPSTRLIDRQREDSEHPRMSEAVMGELPYHTSRYPLTLQTVYDAV